MKRATTILAASLAGAVCGAAALYALLCIVFAISEPGLQGRTALSLRNGAIALASLGAVVILLRRRAAGRSRPRQALLVLGIALGAALLLFVYAFPYRGSRQAERWARLRSLADHLAAAPGRAGLDLPGPGWSYRVITRRGEGADIVEIALNDPWPGRVFGIDLLQLDHVQIHRTPDGIVRSVNVSYF